jgi:fibronectin type 3 domain-containing protein
VSANPGFVFYSASSFDKIGRAVKDSLQNNYTKNIAFPPVMSWLDKRAPSAPSLNVTAKGNKVVLKWEPAEREDGLRYAVYRFHNNENVDLDRSERIISLQRSTSFTDEEAGDFKQCTYVVTALDRTWNESKPSNEVEAGRN